jgi:hypothetical protein
MRIVGACARHALLVIGVALVLCAGAFAYSATHIAIDTDSTKLISSELPWRQREIVFDAAFPHRVDLIAVVIDGATPELAEAAAAAITQRLSAQTQVVRAVWRPDGGPYFDRVGLLFESAFELARTTEQLIAAQPLLGMLAADPSLRGLMDALARSVEGVRDDRGKLAQLAHPLTRLADTFDAIEASQTASYSWRNMVTGRAPDARELRRFILVQPVLDYSALQPGARATASIRQASADTGLVGDARVRVRLTGPTPLADEEFATLAQGAALNATLTLLAVVALLWIALRSARLIVAILLCLMGGLLITAAFGLAVFGTFNLISVAFAVLFVGLGVDFGIQFCISYRAQRYVRDDLHNALRDAGGQVGPPLALAAAATAAGFFSFLPTAYRGLSELGVIAGTGMIIAFVASITLLPALIAVSRPPGERERVGYAALSPLDCALARRHHGVLAAAGLVAVSCLLLLPRLQFDFNLLHLRSADVESVSTLLDLMKSPDTTPNTIDVLRPSLADAAAFAERLAQLPEVDRTLTLASFVPEQQPEKLAQIEDAALLLDPALNPGATRPPPNDDEIVRAMQRAAQSLDQVPGVDSGDAIARDAQRLARALRNVAAARPALRERAQVLFMPGLDTTLRQLRTALTAKPVTLADLPRDLVRDWVAPDGRARIEVFPKGDANDNTTLRRFVAAVQTLAPDATGAPVSLQESGRTIVRAFIEAGLWALLSICVLLAITLRRVADVLLTLAPLLLSGLVTLGLCAALAMPLNFENIIALPLLFGIGVAFNIYFVMAWRRGAEELLTTSLARAVIFSALVTGTAFGSLWLSHHPGTASMGRLLALSLACTLVSALLFLPALLWTVRRSQRLT